MAFQETNKKILVVDDSDVTQHAIKELLADSDVEVVSCRDGLEGIKRSVEIKPDIILLDIMMPNLDGLKMLQIIRMIDDLSKIPVLIISANTNKSNVISAMEAGAENVISKPVSKQSLITEIKKILGADYFKSNKPSTALTVSDQKEIQGRLRKIFLNSFPAKKYGLIESINNRNKAILKQIVHEIKGSGGAIGYPILTSLSSEIEKDISTFPINWSKIKYKCEKIIEIVSDIDKQDTYIG